MRQWNALPREIGDSPTIERFHETITPEKKIVPKRFYHGNRKSETHDNRLCEQLNKFTIYHDILYNNTMFI